MEPSRQTVLCDPVTATRGSFGPLGGLTVVWAALPEADQVGAMPDRIARTSLALFAVTTVIFWLAAVRGAFDGPSYQWRLFGLGGRGVGGDYWFPLAGVSGALIVLAGGWRCKRWAFAVLATWSVLVLVAVLALVASSPDDFRFRGDTFGMDVSLAWVGPLLFGAGAVLSVVAAWRLYRQSTVVAAWNARNARWLILLATALPLQFVLLRFGGAESLSDQVGVLVTIVQWLMVGRIFRPYPDVGEAA
jgi:hypothetical protein